MAGAVQDGSLHGLADTGRPWFSDGGLETDIIYNQGFDLPHFAAFSLLGDEVGEAALTRYFEGYMTLAAQNGTGFVRNVSCGVRGIPRRCTCTGTARTGVGG